MADDLDFDTPSADDFAEEEDEPQRPAPKAKKVAPMKRAPMPPAEEEAYEEEQQPVAPPQRRPMPRQMPPQQQQPQPMPQQAPQAQQQAPALGSIVPYEMPKRMGYYDRTTQKPIIEDEDKDRVILAALAEIMNRLERIEASLS